MEGREGGREGERERGREIGGRDDCYTYYSDGTTIQQIIYITMTSRIT